MVNQVSHMDELRNISHSISMTKIAIGSTNPVKIQAVKNALNNEKILIIPCSASSNVRAQPLSDDETLQGASNRAQDCLQKTEAAWAIGLEGLSYCTTRFIFAIGVRL